MNVPFELIVTLPPSAVACVPTVAAVSVAASSGSPEARKNAAISSPNRANVCSTASTSLYGNTIVSAAVAPVTPGEDGRPSVATPDPASASSASTWPW